MQEDHILNSSLVFTNTNLFLPFSAPVVSAKNPSFAFWAWASELNEK